MSPLPKKRAIAAALALFAIAATASPAGAAAVTRHVHEPGVSFLELHLRGSGGYRIDLFDAGPLGAIVTATRHGPESFETATYSTRHGASSRPGKRLVNVRIGRFGHFRGHLVVESTKEEKLERGCKGDPTVVERGEFVGSFRFRAEAGFTRVHSTRAPGSIVSRAAETCTIHVPRRHPGRERAERGRGARRAPGEYKLVAGDLEGTSFQAEHQGEGPLGGEATTFSASVYERVGDLSVGHYVTLFAVRADQSPLFEVPSLTEPLSEAVLTPPAPFSGSAVFWSDGSRSGSWTGDLAVSFPGLPVTPLTGAGIEAGLCVGRAGCTETLPSQLQPVLEAGPGEIVAVATKKK